MTFHGRRHPREVGATELEPFSAHPAANRKVGASTQNRTTRGQGHDGSIGPRSRRPPQALPDLEVRRERRSRGPVGREFLAYVLERLAAIESLRARRMFSAAGLYSDDTFFGLVADDVLYFKVDDSTRRDYEARGMAPVRRARRGSGRRPVRRSRVGTSG